LCKINGNGDRQQEHGFLDIYDSLKQDILTRKYGPGEKLPSEHQLAVRFNSKRFMVRKAIEKMVRDELVYVIRNKGYYVRSNDINIKIRKDANYTRNMLAHKLTPRVRLLELKISEPAREQRDLFQLYPGEKLWEIMVLRFYRGIPHALARSYLPFKRIPDFKQHYLKALSIYKVLEEYYGIKPRRKNSLCKAVLSDKREARLLEIFENYPLLRVVSINVDQHGIPIEQCISKFRSDIVQLNINFEN
jgi:GntR family phosphonate transport system transcriptional regulator